MILPSIIGGKTFRRYPAGDGPRDADPETVRNCPRGFPQILCHTTHSGIRRHQRGPPGTARVVGAKAAANWPNPDPCQRRRWRRRCIATGEITGANRPGTGPSACFGASAAEAIYAAGRVFFMAMGSMAGCAHC
jgi:hypothetical protein